MAKCPVCKTEYQHTNNCQVCGFDQLGKEFLNKDEAELWKKDILLPFIKTYVCDPEDFVIEDDVLTEFCGQKPIVVLPDNVIKIDNYVFNECEYIKRVVLPSGLSELGWSVFADSGLGGEIHIPDKITKLPDSVFAGCETLKRVVLPINLNVIECQAFSECEGLTELTIPDSVKSIEFQAFFNCTSLDKIVIPKSVERIEGNAFEGCDNLTIFCEHMSKPDGWDSDWCEHFQYVMKNRQPRDLPKAIYWGDEWHYENGEPVPNKRKR